MTDNLLRDKLNKLHFLKKRLNRIRLRINRYKNQIDHSRVHDKSNNHLRLSEDITDEEIEDIQDEAMKLYYVPQQNIYDTTPKENNNQIKEVRAKCAQIIEKSKHKK